MTEVQQQLLSPIPALQCPTLLPPLNGRVSATYTCSTGYTLIGSSTRTCQTNEQWSGNAPTCQGDCDLCCHGFLHCYYLGAHAQARYTVVCLCVCVDCYSCSRMNQVQVRVSIGF